LGGGGNFLKFGQENPNPKKTIVLLNEECYISSHCHPFVILKLMWLLKSPLNQNPTMIYHKFNGNFKNYINFERTKEEQGDNMQHSSCLIVLLYIYSILSMFSTWRWNTNVPMVTPTHDECSNLCINSPKVHVVLVNFLEKWLTHRLSNVSRRLPRKCQPKRQETEHFLLPTQDK
jgi:hypothetical protein